MLRLGLAGVRPGRAAAVEQTTSTLRARVSRLLSFGAAAAGVRLQASFLWKTMRVGAAISGSAMLRTSVGLWYGEAASLVGHWRALCVEKDHNQQ